MGTVIDLSAESSGGFEPVPGGQYHVAITDGEVRESGPEAKNPGAKYIAWEFTVQSGEFENRKLWTNTSMLPQAIFGIKGLVAAAPRSGLNPNGSLDTEECTIDGVPIIEAMQGQEVCAVVTKKLKPAQYANFEGEMQNNIKSFKPLDQYKAPSAAAKNSLLP